MGAGGRSNSSFEARGMSAVIPDNSDFFPNGLCSTSSRCTLLRIAILKIFPEIFFKG